MVFSENLSVHSKRNCRHSEEMNRCKENGLHGVNSSLGKDAESHSDITRHSISQHALVLKVSQTICLDAAETIIR